MARGGKKCSFKYHVTKFREYISKSDYLGAESELNHVKIALGDLRTLTDNLIVLYDEGEGALVNAELDELYIFEGTFILYINDSMYDTLSVTE